jgi:N,N'-diacetyllegionaminate synthase
VNKTVTICGKKIGNSSPTFIVAEAGLNHNGRLKFAKELIKRASEINADAIKFQTYITEDFVGERSPYFKLFKKYELSFAEFQELSDLSSELGITFLSTPLDFQSADFLDKIGVPAFKVASGDLTNYPFLKHLSEKHRPIILSTGMASLEEVADTVKFLSEAKIQELVLLHCVSNYPTSIENANLKSMSVLKNAFQVPVGFSDHTMNLLTPVIAVAMGASLIEKHFTLNKRLSGPDHRCSLDTKQFAKMINDIRQVEKMFGFAKKETAKNEIEISKIARRSIVARKFIPKGTVLNENMLTFRRPGDGISPKQMDSIIGLITKFDIESGETLTWKKLVD